MDKKAEITKKQIGKNWEMFNKLHEVLMSIDKNVFFRIFPIYAKYFLNDEVFAVVFYKFSSTKDNQVDLGLKFETKPLIKGIKDAKYMKDPSVNFSMLINEDNFIKNKIRILVKESLIKNSNNE